MRPTPVWGEGGRWGERERRVHCICNETNIDYSVVQNIHVHVHVYFVREKV